VACDKKCSLGKWIFAHEDKYSSLNEYYELKRIHALFHQHAATLVSKINKGENFDTFSELGPQSIYAHNSTDVIQSLLTLKKTIES
ncbi:MAG TPA: CZB domain-containing protein, partial [Pseudobdellovibrionaceae bacterium]|nr:CZB domain-containing protein [Pseudobdellovibrionaceae bacterium]